MKLFKKRRLEMTEGPLAPQILRFAIPIALTGILQQLFNAADVAIVGRFVGEVAMAAVGANAPIVSLIINFLVGISLGIMVIIANAKGRRDRITIHKAVHTGIIAAVISGVIMAILGEFFAISILQSLQVPGEVLPMATNYLRIYLLGVPFIVLYNVESAIYRAIGNTSTPLIALAISGLMNLILNTFFVVGLKMTVEGVALATFLSNAIISVALLIRLFQTDSDIGLRRQEMRIDGPVLREILQIGLPAGLQGAVFSVANIVLQGAINTLGTIVMAASSAAFNIEIIAYSVFNSFTQACTTFVGQNNGARLYERCKQVLKVCFLEDIVASAIAMGLILLFGRTMLGFFNGNPEVISIGYQRLLFLFVAYIFSMQYEMIAGYMRGFGISTLPSILTMIGIISVRLFIIFVIFPQRPQFDTIMSAYPISMFVTALMQYIALAYLRPATRRLNEASLQNELN